MITKNVSELRGIALSWLVNVCHGHTPSVKRTEDNIFFFGGRTDYATAWEFGGPIIDREGIELENSNDLTKGKKFARMRSVDFRFGMFGDTNLEAAMRCYIVSKLGETVEIPDELVEG